MFFIMGINTRRKELTCEEPVVCAGCGQYTRYVIYMTYTVLSLFFIPVLKWNRKYYVTTRCCKRTYALDPEIGRKLAHGDPVPILPQHLTDLDVY